MIPYICNYAPVRFLPYRETGEFVNLGIVVHCPELSYFNWRIETKKYKRVTAFFPELNVELLKKGRAHLAESLASFPLAMAADELFAGTVGTEEQMQKSVRLFQELVRVREGLFHFGPTGTLLAANPEEALNGLFDRFVERNFARAHEYQETKMKNRLAEMLKQWNFSHLYRDDKVGTEDYHVSFPFVYSKDGIPQRVIKPLHLDREDSTEIYDHGDMWLTRVRRLKQNGQMPDVVVFPVSMPEAGKTREAAKDVVAEMKLLGVLAPTFPEEDQPRLTQTLWEHVTIGKPATK